MNYITRIGLVLIVTLMPAAAFAENTRGSGDSIEVDDIHKDLIRIRKWGSLSLCHWDIQAKAN